MRHLLPVAAALLLLSSCKKEECEPEIITQTVNVPGPTVYVSQTCQQGNFCYLRLENQTASQYFFSVNDAFWDVLIMPWETIDSVKVPFGDDQRYKVVRTDGGNQYNVTTDVEECGYYYWQFP